MSWNWLSPYLIALSVAWIIAILIKTIINFVKNRHFSRHSVFSTGEMPSAHTAPVAALATMIALVDGIGSAGFAIAFIFAIIVMTDAVNVRRAVGEQGVAIARLLKGADSHPRIVKGHTLLEVVVGALIGIASAIVVFCLSKSC